MLPTTKTKRILIEEQIESFLFFPRNNYLKIENSPFNPFQLFGESNSSNQHQFSFPSFFETNQTRNSRNTFMNNETSANTNTNNRSDFAHNENNRANNNPFQHNEPERDRNPFLEVSNLIFIRE